MGKKIWIINHYATDMYRNGGGRHYWFAKHLLKRGYQPTVFCANTYHNKSDYIDTKNKKFLIDKKNNIPFVFIKTSIALGNGIDRVKNMTLFYWNLLSVAKEYVKLYGKPDIIVASSVHPLTMVAGIKIAKKLEIPCVCEVRDLWPEAIFAFDKAKEKSLIGRCLTIGEHWIYRNADAMIFTKEGDTDYILEKQWSIEQGGKIDLKKCHYINNGVDLKSFKESEINNVIQDEDLFDNKFNVVYVGAIRPVNNLGNVLDTAKLLKDNDEIQFLIYGDGNEKEMLEQRIKNEKINNVKIKGFVNKKYIPFILSKADVNILNYSGTKYNWTRGNSSNKLFEYMASGKPIISTVKMGYSIIEKYDCGIELINGTANELSEAVLEIKNMSQDEYQRVSKNAKIGAKDFDFSKLTDKLIDVLTKVQVKEKEV